MQKLDNVNMQHPVIRKYKKKVPPIHATNLALAKHIHKYYENSNVQLEPARDEFDQPKLHTKFRDSIMSTN